jgi:hypothetical protein
MVRTTTATDAPRRVPGGAAVMRLAALLLCAVAAAAHAEDTETRPWAVGVPAEQQEVALGLFARGNDAFAHFDYATAASLYHEALTHWAHPAIHGNLAVTLIQLDDPVAAYDEIELALRHGEAPFDAAVFRQLSTDRKLLRAQLGMLAIRSEVSGAEVTIDGERVLSGVGAFTRRVRTGSYQVVARKPAHLTFARDITVLPEKSVDIVVQLVPLDQVGGSERRWRPWIPWLVVGGGAVVLGTGIATRLAAQSNVDAYEAEIARSCPDGCPESSLPQAVRDLEGRARLENRIGITAIVAGSAALITGGVLVYLNQPRRVRLDESGRRVTAAPLVSPDAVGLSFAGRF